jgi:low temperature requirement protein LtrA
MAATSEAGTPTDAPAPDLEERRTSPVELLWDLVFVFAVTQVTTLMRHHLDWGRFGEAMIVLALVWWAWSAFVWAANAQTGTERSTRIVLLAAMALIFVSGLALPEAFTTRALLFASSYAIVRFLHLALYADASRKGRASWRSIVGFAVTVVIGMGLRVVGALAHHTARIVLWTAAIAIDYAGPAWLTRKRLRGLQRVAVAHFAERYSLFIIICLGESIVGIGTGAAPIDTSRVVAVSLCLLITVALWWAYFDELAEIAQRRLRDHDDPVLAAADGYSYMHLLIVAGIIIFAVGARLLVHVGDGALGAAGRLALTGGVALYLTGMEAFALRMLGAADPFKLVGAVALVLVGWLGSGLHGFAVASIAFAVLVALIGRRALFGAEDRARTAEDQPRTPQDQAPTR